MFDIWLLGSGGKQPASCINLNCLSCARGQSFLCSSASRGPRVRPSVRVNFHYQLDCICHQLGDTSLGGSVNFWGGLVEGRLSIRVDGSTPQQPRYKERGSRKSNIEFSVFLLAFTSWVERTHPAYASALHCYQNPAFLAFCTG